MTETAPIHTAPSPPPDDSQGKAPNFPQILTSLQALYPHCFFAADTEPKPLKIGIHKDLQARDLPDGVTATRLRNFLAWYTKRYRYRKVLIKGGQRVDLEGNPAGEVTDEQTANAKLSLKSKAPPPPPGSPLAQLPVDAPLIQENTVPGRLELTIKFNELPKPVQVQGGFKFGLDCDGRPVVVVLKPKAWNKLVQAAAEYPQWVAALSGKMGEAQGKGFVLAEPALQVFEKKPKVQEPAADSTPPQAVGTPPPAAPEPSALAKPKLSLKR